MGQSFLVQKKVVKGDSLPEGGVDGQVLVKVGETEGEAKWDTLYSYGTTDLTPGVSDLETGKLYFVY